MWGGESSDRDPRGKTYFENVRRFFSLLEKLNLGVFKTFKAFVIKGISPLKLLLEVGN